MNPQDDQEESNGHDQFHPDDRKERINEDGIEEDDQDDDQKSAPASLKPAGRGFHRPAAEEEEELPPSKTRIKKQMHELQDLGAELVGLGKDQLAQLDIPENLRDAIREMHRINKFGAQRRQMQYIGKLMRDVETAPIIARLNAWKGISQQHIGYMHQLERWRERLLESDASLTELLSKYPTADAQKLRTLIRNTQKEREAQKPPKHFRELFQVLRDIIPEPH